MSKKNIILLFILIFFANKLISQTVYDGYQSINDKLLHSTPAEQLQLTQATQLINNYIQQHPNLAHQKTVIVVPVVVHVLYHTLAQNLSDAQINSQITVLNEDYRRQNADTANTRAVFKPVAADCQIQFKLATQDINGKPTTGIIHNYTAVDTFYDASDPFFITHAMKDTLTGGENGWDMTKYLNIWVCNIYSNLLGYSSLPGDPPSHDGVVINFNYFGKLGATFPPYDLGRTTTHEVGHWLGLFHPFDGGCAGMTAGNCATQGDLICDTPPVSSALFGCDQTNNTCSEIPNKLDMVENYMMYTDDGCMNMFTQNQSARMLSTLNSFRPTIATSPGAVTIPLLGNDIGVYYVTEPFAGDACPNTPVVRVHNFGSNTVTNFTVSVQIDNDAIHNFTWAGSLPTGSNTNVTLSALSPVATPGLHTFKAWTTLPNNVTDDNSANDVKKTSFDCFNVGINTVATSQSIKVYPNPVADVLQINTLDIELKEINLYNAVGQLVYHLSAVSANTHFQLNVNELSNGIYVLEMVKANGKVQREKISVIK